MTLVKTKENGFTLIEIMITLLIASVLAAFVGPLAINSLDKASSKQELLGIENWLKKIGMRAYATGQMHKLTLDGKSAKLYAMESGESVPKLVTSKEFEYNFFVPQVVNYSKNGFVVPNIIEVTHRNGVVQINLAESLNLRQASLN